jgi:hypothetical protein
VPIAPVVVSATVVRPGRSVELVEGTLSSNGEELIRARAWRVRTIELVLDEHSPEPPPKPGPDAARARDFFPVEWDVGYHSAMEVRFVSGAFVEPGPAVAWLRMRVPLIEGEEPSALQRVLVAADTGNGVSAPLDYRKWLFINADVSLALRRLPRGEWVCLDAVTYTERDGIGLTDTALHDSEGMIGRVTQSLLVGHR